MIAKNVYYFLEVVGTAAREDWLALLHVPPPPPVEGDSNEAEEEEEEEEEEETQASPHVYTTVSSEEASKEIGLDYYIKCGDQSSALHHNPSPQAKAFRATMNPFATCPHGSLAYYDSDELFEMGLDVNHMGRNEQSHWDIVQDRPSKFGFIIEKSSDDSSGGGGGGVENNDSDSLRFNLTFSETPFVTLEYMHSYENAGKILISIEQVLVATKSSESTTKEDETNVDQHQEGILSKKGNSDYTDGAFSVITPTSTLVLDSYDPSTRHALYTEIEIKPIGFQPGPVVVKLELVRLTEAEMEERGGNRFKAVSIRSC
jgi:hypothetical protein